MPGFWVGPLLMLIPTPMAPTRLRKTFFSLISLPPMDAKPATLLFFSWVIVSKIKKQAKWNRARRCCQTRCGFGNWWKYTYKCFLLLTQTQTDPQTAIWGARLMSCRHKYRRVKIHAHLHYFKQNSMIGQPFHRNHPHICRDRKISKLTNTANQIGAWLEEILLFLFLTYVGLWGTQSFWSWSDWWLPRGYRKRWSIHWCAQSRHQPGNQRRILYYARRLNYKCICTDDFVAAIKCHGNIGWIYHPQNPNKSIHVFACCCGKKHPPAEVNHSKWCKRWLITAVPACSMSWKSSVKKLFSRFTHREYFIF